MKVNKIENMKRERQGTLIKSPIVAGEGYESYLPYPLPPKPAIGMEVASWLEKANLAIGELNATIESVPHPDIINYMYVRKEAVLSSQIEGTQSTLDDLLIYESGNAIGTPVDDVAEVSSYVSALNHGLKRIADDFPLSLRLIREIHKELLSNTRGKNKNPGEFRTSQNWIGGTRPGNARFVPPPPENVLDLMSNLEKFIHAQDQIPLLIKAALIHHQFETIHPFLDGNGRVGRLLITLYLCERGFLKSPFLYLSLFLKQHRNLYYEKLSEVRQIGDWESWVNFFLEGVVETATDAKNTLIKIKKIFEKDDATISKMGRSRVSVALVLNEFKRKPLLSIAEITKAIKLTKPTAISSVERLIELGILKNISERKWKQIYSYSEYTDLLGG